MQQKPEKELRPYHETIKDMIAGAPNEFIPEIAAMLKSTKIPDPEAIDGIIETWKAKLVAMCWGDLDLGVPAALLKQKEAAREKAKQVKPVELADLQKEMEIFLAVSHNHRLYGGGLPWRKSLRHRLEKLNRLISLALQDK